MRTGARIAQVVGIVGVVLGLAKLHAAYVAVPAYDFTGSSRFAWTLAYIVVLVVVSYGLGLPDLPGTLREAFFTSIAATVVSVLAISSVQLVTGDALLPRFVVFGSASLLVPWLTLCSELSRGGRDRAVQRDRVLLVGPATLATELAADLALEPEKPAGVVATISPAEAAGHPGEGGPASPLLERARAEDATVVVLDREAQADDSVVGQAAALHESGIRIRTVGLFYEEWLAKLPVSDLERVSLFFDIGELHRLRYGRSKRVVDIVLGLLGLVPLVLLLPVVAVGDVVANRGPLFYRQPRVGRFGSTFRILKFRTMRPVADGELANEWTAEDDPRITPFGKFLRVSHLDELPQVLNILRGDLSVVGPRPEQPHYVEELSGKLPFYRLRHLVRPGLTGWAQVKYGYAGDESDALEKLQYEFFYLRHQNLAFDLRIIGRTVRSVLGTQGRGR